MTAKEKITYSYSQAHRQETTNNDLQLKTRLATREIATIQHHRNSQRNHNIGQNILHGSYLIGNEGKITHNHTDGIKYHNRAKFAQQRISTAEPYYTRRSDTKHRDEYYVIDYTHNIFD